MTQRWDSATERGGFGAIAPTQAAGEANPGQLLENDGRAARVKRALLHALDAAADRHAEAAFAYSDAKPELGRAIQEAHRAGHDDRAAHRSEPADVYKLLRRDVRRGFAHYLLGSRRGARREPSPRRYAQTLVARSVTLHSLIGDSPVLLADARAGGRWSSIAAIDAAAECQVTIELDHTPGDELQR